MISNKEIKKQYDTVCNALSDKRIKEGLNIIRGLAIESHNSKLIDEHYNLELSYKNVLKYTVEGFTDPERQQVYNRLVKDIYTLADRIYVQLLTSATASNVNNSVLSQLVEDYITELNVWHMKRITDKTLSDSEELAGSAESVFNELCLSNAITPANIQALKSICENNQVPWYHLSLFVSGISLSLFHVFSAELIGLLMDLVKHPNDQVSGRATVALLLGLYKYDDRLYLYPKLFTRLFLLLEEEGMNTLFQSVIIQLIRTRETEKISQKLHDEIIPEVVKVQPQLNDKLDLEKLLAEGMGDDKNPEWEDLFKDSTLIGKLEELTQWQMEGTDVFMATFKMLKHFPFFNNTANWLVPFYVNNPEIVKVLEAEDESFRSGALLDTLAKSRFLCNADKYSLVLSIQHMPEMQKNLMKQMFSADMEQMAEIEKDERSLKAHYAKLVVSNQFIQDLYRLVKLHPQKHLFEDIFALRMDFHNKWFFLQSPFDPNVLKEIGEFYFQKNYFEDALEIFTLCLKQEEESGGIIQKIAYCYQHLKNYSNALQYYLKAELLTPESNWLKKKKVPTATLR